ncbi:MAG: hypothetical protein M5U07_03425 [Xanthobacteraceae bacterium]|nr:hypothetical protein [Xanthobacteraceae bacterium]PWB59777.1 MAG: hypothetical protein C3F17_16005 [Bradyrhizobiaceae bacterium]
MATVATVLACLGFAGAAACWIFAAVAYGRTLAAIGKGRTRWLAVVAWPFAARRLGGVAAAHAARVNKAFVAFFVCLLVAIAATSVATNLHRIAR